MNSIEILKSTNRWWDTGKIDAVFLEEEVRDEFSQIRSALDARRILAILGPRRVGKSTLVYQIIDSLLKGGTDPAHIMLFSGDNPGFIGGGETISSVIAAYIDVKLHKPIIEMNTRIYIFIDEIHFLADWQLHVKSLYDLNPNLKFVISGSSSIQMFLGARDSLLGRITDIHVLPFCFDQFLRFYSFFKKTFDHGRYMAALPTRSPFDDPEAYCRHLETKQMDLSFFDLALNHAVKTFFISGGYPEYFKTDSILYWQKVLTEDVIEKGLYRDIVSFYRVTNPMALERLLYLIAANNGGEYAYAGLGAELGIDTTTASTYLHYLDQACLITILENYSSNRAKILRKNKKIYVSDNGILNGIINNETLNARDEGFLAENACVQLARSYCEAHSFNLFFWRDKQTEVDLVIDKKTHLLPVEVKYRNKIKPEDTGGLRVFMDKYGLKTGLVITKNTLMREGGIYYVPFRWIRAPGR
jgi:predicted AAA+ superfamily ATPase